MAWPGPQTLKTNTMMLHWLLELPCADGSMVAFQSLPASRLQGMPVIIFSQQGLMQTGIANHPSIVIHSSMAFKSSPAHIAVRLP